MMYICAMGIAIAPAAPDGVAPFRYVGGDWSVDFVNTANWPGRRLDRFTGYARVLEWAEGAGAVSAATASSLRALGDEFPARAVRVLAEAVQLRQLLERLFYRISQHQPAPDEIAALNEQWLSRSLADLALLDRGDGTLGLGWPRADTALESPLWVVARAAAMLLASGDAPRIRRCEGDGCGWYYVDRSRNGLRRWCEMETCGTRMKSRRRAERTSISHATGDERQPAPS